MQIGVKIDKILNNPQSKVLATASLTLDGAFAVHGLRVMNSQNGRFVTMPSVSYQDREGKTQYSDTFHPVTKQARDYIQAAVLQAYDAAVQQQTFVPQFAPEQNVGQDMSCPF